MNTDCNCFVYLGNNFQSLKAKIVVKQKKKKKKSKSNREFNYLLGDQLKTQQKSIKTTEGKKTQINNAKND